MIRRLFYLFITCYLIVLLSCAVITRAEPVIIENRNSWTCYDWSTQFKEDNPEWGILTMSNNIYFKGVSHMVNYQLRGNDLLIHDQLYQWDYTIYNYSTSGICFHFWGENETPVRTYKFLRVNTP